jgi:hypothetical protein
MNKALDFQKREPAGLATGLAGAVGGLGVKGAEVTGGLVSFGAVVGQRVPSKVERKTSFRDNGKAEITARLTGTLEKCNVIEAESTKDLVGYTRPRKLKMRYGVRRRSMAGLTAWLGPGSLARPQLK